jgi:hypothetical protein
MSLLLVGGWLDGRVRSFIAATIDLAIRFLGLRLRLVQELRSLFSRLGGISAHTTLCQTITLGSFRGTGENPVPHIFFIDINAGKAKSFSTPGSPKLFRRFKSTYIPFICMDILRRTPFRSFLT